MKDNRRSLGYRRHGVRKGLDAAVRDGYVSIDFRDSETLWITIHTPACDVTLEVTPEEMDALREGFDQ